MSDTSKDETGWLCEQQDDNGGSPWYHILEEPHWTQDASKAIRFARKVDAEAYIEDMGWCYDIKPVEHMWCAPPPQRMEG